MANTASPVGFLHLGNVDGTSPTFGHIAMKIANADTTKVFKGDPVKQLNTGYVAQWTATTAVSQLKGIFVGCEYLSSAGLGIVRSPYWPGSGATGDITAFLIPCNLTAPGLFMAQTIGSTAIAFAQIGECVDVSLGTGSTITGLSAAGPDFSTLGTTATLPFRIVGHNGLVGPAIGPSGIANDNTLANNWVYLACNTAGAGSTGV